MPAGSGPDVERAQDPDVEPEVHAPPARPEAVGQRPVGRPLQRERLHVLEIDVERAVGDGCRGSDGDEQGEQRGERAE